jgi:hypothetical protein
VARYEELYARGAYVPREESERIQQLLRTSMRDPASRLGVRNMRGVAAPEADSGSRPARRVVQHSLF